MCNINHPKFPCRICAKNVHDKDKAVQCDLCELWIHIKCNKLYYLDYRYLQNYDESWYCIDCCSTIFSFNSLGQTRVKWVITNNHYVLLTLLSPQLAATILVCISHCSSNAAIFVNILLRLTSEEERSVIAQACIFLMSQ